MNKPQYQPVLAAQGAEAFLIMDISPLTPFFIDTANFLVLVATLFVIVFGISLPFMLACVAFICLGVELHYRELTRLTNEDWTEESYSSISAPVECGPIWEAVQPEWRAA